MRMKRGKLPKATKAEIRQAREEQAFWEELCKYLPWRVHGWTGKSHACYITAPVKRLAGNGEDAKLWNAIVLPRLVENQRSLIEVSGEQCTQILTALKGLEEK